MAMQARCLEESKMILCTLGMQSFRTDKLASLLVPQQEEAGSQTLVQALSCTLKPTEPSSKQLPKTLNP